MTGEARSIQTIVAEADRCATRGDVAAARLLLDEAVKLKPDDVDSWLKLASMCRAAGDIEAAMRAASGALNAEPLHFVALLLRASLLERQGSSEAGEAYGRALAQRPDAALPPQLAAMVGRATERYRTHIARNEAHLAAAMTDAEQAASPDEAARMKRFRTNTLRLTRAYHAEPTHYHYPGLSEREFHDRTLFAWLPQLEAATDAIAADFERVMSAERAELVPYIQYPDGVPLRQWKALNHSSEWTAIHLLQNGRRIDANARHCEATMAVLSTIPQPRIPNCSPNAMFSLLAPGAHIPPHHGVANTRLVCHLPLIVPDGCSFRVGAETRCWRRGEAFVFDDTIEHEAANESGMLRVVLIFDLWHPGLAPIEREAVTILMTTHGAGGDGAL